VTSDIVQMAADAAALPEAMKELVRLRKLIRAALNACDSATVTFGEALTESLEAAAWKDPE